MREAAPQVLVIAGANGSGKSTVAPFLMAQMGIRTFLNADDIARELSPANVAAAAVAAGRMMHARIEEFRRRRESFAIETTLSGRTLLRHLIRLQEAGFLASMIFLWIPQADLAVRRVRLRAEMGGHYVPEADVRRRVARSVYNFDYIYRPVVPFWRAFNGAAPRVAGEPPLIASGSGAIVETVANRSAWLALRVHAAQSRGDADDE